MAKYNGLRVSLNPTVILHEVILHHLVLEEFIEYTSI